MIETKQCSLCCENPPYRSCFAREDGVTDTPVCARLAMYENAKLPVRAREFVLNSPTDGPCDVVLASEYALLLAYAARLACDLLMVNGTIQKAARDAEKYIEVVHNAEKERS